ncbi:MAG: hypothetical protein K0R85_259 [Devosia sp.]|jgi:hypothetical protein|nr:hypothetical protein [Devosia sp.]
MARYAVAGCKFFIGGAVADKGTDFVAADFTSQTWIEVGEWVTMGDMGDAAADITSQVVGEQRDKHAKGTRNAATMENVFNFDALDPGQIALIAAERSSNNFAFKIELNDKPAVGAAPKNSLRYFIALVNSARETGGGANTLRTLAVSLQPNSNFVRVAASAT